MAKDNKNSGREPALDTGSRTKLKRKDFERELRTLQAPSDREKSQLYIQRYIAQFPAAGEIILFDRSWYNRAGVERVMGFCSDEQYEHFLKLAPAVEREIVSNGIILLKYFLDVSQDEQRRRFEARIDDPIKHWKLSPMDVESVRRWWDYTQVYQAMIEATDTPAAPWHVVPADDKRRARLNLIRHLLDHVPYRKVAVELPKVPKAQERPKRAEDGLGARHVVPNRY
jgi:polyphosphate kinase